jgi:Protein ChrB, N-terminal
MSAPDENPVPPGEWALLSYWLPREPSTPRIAVWRKLKRLGVAQLGDGLVALPADARTREHLDWLADEIVDAGGTATIWLARSAAARAGQELAAELTAARAAEYERVREEATAAADLDDAGRRAALRRLRGELRRISRRDYFPPPERAAAYAAVAALTDDDHLAEGDDQ